VTGLQWALFVALIIVVLIALRDPEE